MSLLDLPRLTGIPHRNIDAVGGLRVISHVILSSTDYIFMTISTWDYLPPLEFDPFHEVELIVCQSARTFDRASPTFDKPLHDAMVILVKRFNEWIFWRRGNKRFSPNIRIRFTKE